MQTLLSYIGAHPHLALFVVFMTACLESIAVIGVIVPATIILFAAGALVATGAIDLWHMLLVAVLGAVLGDGFSFEIGHRYSTRIKSWPLVQRHAATYERGEAYVHRYGGRSIVLARFVAPMRAIVPLIAGVVNMPRRKFYFFNIISAFIWAPLHILPGVLFGASLGVAEAVTGRLVVVVLLLVGLIWGVVWLVRLCAGAVLPALLSSRDKLVRWARRRDSRGARFLLFFLDPTRAESQMLLLLALMVLASAALFFTLLEHLITRDELLQIDLAIFHFFHGLRTTAADRILTAIMQFGSATVLVPLVLIVLTVLLVRRSWHAAAYWLAAAASPAVMVPVLQFALGRDRTALLNAGELFEKFSFPSEPATSVMVIYGFLSFLLARQQRPAFSLAVTAIASITIMLTGFSWLYLGAQRFSDVIGGFSLGLLWITLLAMMYTHYQPRHRLRTRELGMLALGAVAAFGSLQIDLHYSADLQRLTPAEQPRELTQAQWHAEGWRQLPRRRIVTAGEAREALNVQWAGSTADMTRHLVKAGWRPATEWSLKSGLLWLQTDASAGVLPVLPKFNAGASSSLAFVHVDPARPDTRLVLRLWKSNLFLQDPATPIWYGGLYREKIGLPWRLLHVSRTAEAGLAPASLKEWPREPAQLTRQDRYGQITLTRSN